MDIIVQAFSNVYSDLSVLLSRYWLQALLVVLALAGTGLLISKWSWVKAHWPTCWRWSVTTITKLGALVPSKAWQLTKELSMKLPVNFMSVIGLLLGGGLLMTWVFPQTLTAYWPFGLGTLQVLLGAAVGLWLSRLATARRDLLFGPITWFGFLAVWGTIFGGVITGVLWCGLELLAHTNSFPANPLPNENYVLLWGALALLAFIPDFDEYGNIKVEQVPQTFFIAYVTLFGKLLPIGRVTGAYPCTGRWVGLGRSTAKSNTLTDTNGYVIGGDITFQVWQSAHSIKEENGKKIGDTRIEEPAKNGASVSASLTLILEREKPSLWLDAEDADTEVGNASRQAYLEFLTNFNDTDLPAVVGKMEEWMTGGVFVTAYTTRQVREFRAGSIARDKNGTPLLTRVKEGETEAEAIERFREEFLKRVEPDMEKVVKDDREERVALEPVAVRTTQPVDEVIERRGYHLKSVNLEGVKYSTKVQQEADKASSEFFQFDSQNRSAEAQAKYMERLGLGEDDKALAAMLAFGQDHPESVNLSIFPPGSGDIKGGASILAGKLGGKDDKS